MDGCIPALDVWLFFKGGQTDFGLKNPALYKHNELMKA